MLTGKVKVNGVYQLATSLAATGNSHAPWDHTLTEA